MTVLPAKTAGAALHHDANGSLECEEADAERQQDVAERKVSVKKSVYIFNKKVKVFKIEEKSEIRGDSQHKKSAPDSCRWHRICPCRVARSLLFKE